MLVVPVRLLTRAAADNEADGCCVVLPYITHEFMAAVALRVAAFAWFLARTVAQHALPPQGEVSRNSGDWLAAARKKKGRRSCERHPFGIGIHSETSPNDAG